MKKNTVLVPTDFSEVADNALGHAIGIAKTFDNDLALIHVADEGGIFSRNSYDELVKEAIQNKLNSLAEHCKKEGINATTHVRTGKIYKTIVATADELGCDSIIMGTHGASGIEKIIGSNASKVINYSNVPVVIVKEHSSSKASYKNIVLPIDLTLESKQKVKWAIHLAKYYKSTVHLVSFKESDEFLSNRIFAQMVYVENQLAENNIQYDSKILDEDGNYAKQTLNYAEEINADLIIIMSQQDKGMSEYFLGSYAQQIVNQSGKVPVMCVNPSETGMRWDY